MHRLRRLRSRHNKQGCFAYLVGGRHVVVLGLHYL